MTPDTNHISPTADGYRCHGCWQVADTAASIVHSEDCAGSCKFKNCGEHHPAADGLPRLVVS